MDQTKTSANAALPFIVSSIFVLGALWYFCSPLATVAIGIPLATLIISAQLGKMEKNLRRHQNNVFRQIECRMALDKLLNLATPLASTRGYRGSPDFLLQVYEEVTNVRPKVIVEASSGLSTIVCATAIKNSGLSSHVYSLEHEASYAESSREMLKKHWLDATAEVIHAPLVPHNVKGTERLWYDLEKANLPQEIDMIIVDGPPNRTQKHARYPAVPLLVERLSHGGVILMDDSDRKEDSETINMWQKEFPNLQVHRLPMEKGMTILRNT